MYAINTIDYKIIHSIVNIFPVFSVKMEFYFAVHKPEIYEIHIEIKRKQENKTRKKMYFFNICNASI